MGDVDDATACSALLADADVLIDYLKSEFAILSLVAEYVGRVVVLEQVLGEVRGLTAAECERAGIDVIVAETERMLHAAAVESNVSFSDRLCLVTFREERWTCVTDDGALRRLCQRHGVETRYGLGLMVDLVALGALPRQRAESIARKIQTSNPFHINEQVIERFTMRWRDASSRSR